MVLYFWKKKDKIFHWSVIDKFYKTGKVSKEVKSANPKIQSKLVSEKSSEDGK